MTREVRLNELDEVLEGLPYPISRKNVREELDDVVLVYADGEEAATDIVDRSEEDVFDDPADLQTEILNLLPTEAVGEPGQSEGEG
ncbi:DUF5789 family protein [Halospeciosus flavus]|uniref:DUF2795 domain-containing protein n=1 Tax=Halospeciosus flavus TaxID=3032283 RepID=A0ABD5Z533_9EURY|nr:hypothetical protein [Halospeciosus flavus]